MPHATYEGMAGFVKGGILNALTPPIGIPQWVFVINHPLLPCTHEVLPWPAPLLRESLLPLVLGPLWLNSSATLWGGHLPCALEGLWAQRAM